MSKYMVNGSDLTSVADAIRSKTGVSTELEFPNEFVSAVGSISGIEKFRALVDRTIATVTASDLDGITKIGHYAFRGCASLTTITVPLGVTEIQSYAFTYCNLLAYIELPSSLEEILPYAFQNCGQLKTIICNASAPPKLNTGVFSGVPANCNIYVPAQSVEAYKAATYWSDRADYIQAIPQE